MGRMMKLAMAGLAAFGAYKLAAGGRRNERDDGQARLRPGDGHDEFTRRDEITGRDASRKRWDEVDEASLESFPASDPPSHSRGKL